MSVATKFSKNKISQDTRKKSHCPTHTYVKCEPYLHNKVILSKVGYMAKYTHAFFTGAD